MAEHEASYDLSCSKCGVVWPWPSTECDAPVLTGGAALRAEIDMRIALGSTPMTRSEEVAFLKRGRRPAGCSKCGRPY